MRSVMVTGVAGSLGRRVAVRLASEPTDERQDPGEGLIARGIDVRPASGLAIPTETLDVATADLKPLLEGVDTVVHLASTLGPSSTDAGEAVRSDVAITRRMLEAAGDAGVRHVVLVSSATVYGAWPNNPVPLTEAAPVRPNPEFAFAVHKAEIERLATEWALDHPGTTVALLRPVLAVAESETSWLARVFRQLAAVRTTEVDPPVQFVHLDDVADAVALAARRGLDGVFNVAPDGWIAGEAMRALAGGPPRPAVPAALAVRVAAWRRRLHLGQAPEGLVPYTAYPWVVANDRLRAEGWVPGSTSEEAYVASHEPGPLALLSPKRRQELALAGAGAALVVAGAGAAMGFRWARLRAARRA